MLLLDNALSVSYRNMGLFDTDEPWIHPTVCNPTCQLLYVLAGTVDLFEGETRYTLRPGEMLVLDPNVTHGGASESRGHVSFYWLHFETNDLSLWNLPKRADVPPETETVFRELMHLSYSSPRAAELTLAKFLTDLGAETERRSPLAFELQEFIRVHARKPLRVGQLSKRFGYSPDRLSRIYRAEFGCSLKEGVCRARLGCVENYLLNTDFSIGEIAAATGFEDANALTKFFSYHEKMSPLAYRRKFYHIHMNDH